MVQSRTLAQSIFVSYFALIISLFGLILRSLRRLAPTAKPQQAVLFFGLAFGSLCHTWFYMIKFLLWSFYDYEARHSAAGSGESVVDRVTNWLMDSELFEQAWRRVCEGPMNWWWSEQLCVFTVGVWTTFLFVQGCRRRIPHVWAYMLLGQVVAISVASNLFFAAVLLSPARGGSRRPVQVRVLPRVYIPILLSHLTILIAPTVAHPNSKWFLPNLLAMHALLVLPLIEIPYTHTHTQRPSTDMGSSTRTFHSDAGVDSQTFYLCLAGLALVPRAQTYLSLQAISGSELWRTLHEHPAQSSIGYDVLWTTASLAAYCALTGPRSARRGVLGLVSPGLALYLDDDDRRD